MLKDDIAGLISDSANELGYMIYDYSLDIRGGSSRINVKIDSLSGIKHSDCSAYSGRLSQKLDDAALLPGYFLEISSPGLKRKLKAPEDFTRFIDAPAKVVFDDNNKRKTVKGNIARVNKGTVSILTNEEATEIPFADIVRANLDY
jgi:ribosome maturation factor RimP